MAVMATVMAPAPSVMMPASAAVAHMAVAMAMTALHLDHGIVLYRERTCGRHAQHGRGGNRRNQCCRQRRGANQQCTFHVIFLQSRNCDNCHNFPAPEWFPQSLGFGLPTEREEAAAFSGLVACEAADRRTRPDRMPRRHFLCRNFLLRRHVG